MRSAPATAASNSGTNNKPAPDNGGTHYPIAEAAVELAMDARGYTYKQMLELFADQPVTEGFVVNPQVFSEMSQSPVSLFEMTAKEVEMLSSGLVNSNAAKRYNHHQQQQQQYQQQNQSTNYYSRHGNNGQRGNHWGRASRDDNMARNNNYRSSRPGSTMITGGPADGLNEDEMDNSSTTDWIHQSILRDNVGSFSADGVFRMAGSGNEGDEIGGLLEEEEGERRGDADGVHGDALNQDLMGNEDLRHKVSVMVANAAASNTASDDSWAWGDVAKTPSTSAQQHKLIEQAEQIKWWYRDPQGSVQGPFTTSHMQEWFSGGYFPADLQVCHEGGAGYEQLGEMAGRIGDPQDLFSKAALTFVALNQQSSAASASASASGLNTPLPPNAVSRVGSALLLDSIGIDHLRSASASGSASATPLPGSGISQSILDSLATNTPVEAGNSTNGSNVAVTSTLQANQQQTDGSGSGIPKGTHSQTLQLSSLLNEQAGLVSAIGERQHHIARLQEQMQQSLAKLMEDVDQQANAMHMQAQAEGIPVQAEVLLALQRRMQTNEQVIRQEYTQYMQMQATQIAQLETNVDPVIKNIIFNNGAQFALDFIRQQLHELSIKASEESNAILDSTAQESVGNLRQHQVKEKVTEEDVKDTSASLEKMKVSSKTKQNANIHSEVKAYKAKEEGEKVIEPPVNDEMKAPREPTTPPPVAATPAPWSKNATSTKPKQPKRSLLQIQQEEEEAAKKKRQQMQEQQRANAATGSGFGLNYAERIGGSTGGGSGPQPKSFASIMEEQAKEVVNTTTSSSNGVSTMIAAAAAVPESTPAVPLPSSSPGGANATTSGLSSVKPATTATSASVTASTPKQQQRYFNQSAPVPKTSAWDNNNTPAVGSNSSSATATKPTLAAAATIATGPALPSLEFLEWCHSRLTSLRGIDICKFIEMLLTFPLGAPESTLEIITEQVYAYSQTLNGRAFAEDFAKRRNKDHSMVRNGSLKSAPSNWAQILVTSSSGKKGSSGGFASAAKKGNSNKPSLVTASNSNRGGYSSRSRGGAAVDNSFQVVSKRGKK